MISSLTLPHSLMEWTPFVLRLLLLGLLFAVVIVAVAVIVAVDDMKRTLERPLSCSLGENLSGVPAPGAAIFARQLEHIGVATLGCIVIVVVTGPLIPRASLLMQVLEHDKVTAL